MGAVCIYRDTAPQACLQRREEDVRKGRRRSRVADSLTRVGDGRGGK